jgi:hypothetical protein
VNQSCAKALQAALALARESNLHCFPAFIREPSSRPTTPHGFLDASNDPTILRELWRSFPGSLVGVRTGTSSGIDVLDLDQEHPEVHVWWREHRTQLPATRTHRSRSGGLHLIFQHVDGLHCSTSKLARGVDIKADGGCATWWPAVGFPVLCDAEPAPWPPRLLAQLRPASQPQPTDARQVVPDDRRLQQLLRCVSTTPEGQRNAITFWAACRFGEMVTTGLLSESDAIALIVEAATCTGLPRAEAIATARSGLRTAGRS